LYPVSYVVIMMYACVACSARIVGTAGVLSVIGFAGLITARGGISPGIAAALSGTLVVLTALTVILTHNREVRETDRRRGDKRMQAIGQHASDGVLACDANGRIAFQSESVTRIFGYGPDELIGLYAISAVHPVDVPRVAEWFGQLAASAPGTVARTDTRLRRADGSWRHVEVVGSNLLHDPDLASVLLSAHDISERKLLEEQLTHQAFHDPLTGLANRALFRDRVDHAIARGQRTGSAVALFLVDLDNFKLVNDGLGHTAGDDLLVTLAGRLRDELRPSDTVARLGGDEFAILVEDDVTEIAAAGVAERLIRAVRMPVRVGGEERTVSASVGVAILKVQGGDRPPYADAEELMRDADLAMYAAKGAGRNRYAIFDPAMHADLLEEARRRAEFERALVEEQFVVHYQPIVELTSTKVVGVEALVR